MFICIYIINENFEYCASIASVVVESKYILFLVFLVDETAGAEELGNFEQADQGWLLLHVHAFVRDWDCSPGCCCISTNQILVIMGIITNIEQSLVCLVWIGFHNCYHGCNIYIRLSWFLLVFCGV